MDGEQGGRLHCRPKSVTPWRCHAILAVPCRLRLAVPLLTAGVAVARTAPAQTPAPMPATTKPVTLSATIEAIDKGSRMITLKGPQGNLATVYADSSVKRFDELKVGDTVKATYYESIAVNVRQPGAPAPPSSDGGVSLNPSRPGATGSVQETVTVTVISVDRPNRAVTLKRQDGSIISMRVENQQYPTWQSPARPWTSPTRRRC